MSTEAQRAEGWSLRGSQMRAILRLELRKNLLGGRSVLSYLIAGLPVSMFVVIAALPMDEWIEDGVGRAAQIYSVVFQTFILRAVIFFGCVATFTNLFRGEVLDRSLHYYFLAPVRREVLVVGKYLSGLITTGLLFGAMVVTTYALMFVPFGWSLSAEYFFSGPGFGQLLSYLSITFLACLGYGSVFLILGLVFRNPILPGALVLGWEFIHFLLPPLLKKASVIHYLKGLLPMPMSEGPFAVLVEPPSAWVSLVGLVLFSLVTLTLATLWVRRMQIHYSD